MDDDSRIKVNTGQDDTKEETEPEAAKEASDAAAQAGQKETAADASTGKAQTQTADRTEDGSTAADNADDAGDGKDSKDSKDGKDADKDKKGFFHKKDKEKEAMQEKINALQDRVTRQMAEFDNYRKRTEKEKELMFSNGESSVLEKMLPIVDNFERGFDSVSEEDKDDAFVLGMHKVYDQLVKQLKDLGVTEMNAEGKDFDPAYHNAVMQVDSDKYESGKVAQELQKGYMYHDRVLRHAMVSVVK